MKGKGEMERYAYLNAEFMERYVLLNAEFQSIARKDTRKFLKQRNRGKQRKRKNWKN